MGSFDKITGKIKSFAESSAKEATRFSEIATNNVSKMWNSVSSSASEAFDSVSGTASDFWKNKVPSKEELGEWAEGTYSQICSLSKDFDKEKMWKKISSCASKAGQELVLMVLTIYYTISDTLSNKKDDAKQ